MGKHQLRLLKFAIRYLSDGQWHSYGKDQTTVRAVKSLARMDLIELSDVSRQFRLKTNKTENSSK
jgi:hypothetical protein